ncbi:Transcription factor TFIIIB component B'' [Dictyocoela muelleri]|nr:Transcription factor TFIIIB component B'' [Dictyocoela muelleri]
MDKKMNYFLDNRNYRARPKKRIIKKENNENKDEQNNIKEKEFNEYYNENNNNENNNNEYNPNEYINDIINNNELNKFDNEYTNTEFNNDYSLYDFNDSDDHEIINSRTYATGDRHGRWSTKEYILFYKALEICGPEFSLIEQIIKTRTRKQIKNKFKKEMKVNEEKIKKILSMKSVFNNEEFEKLKKENQ